MHKIFSTIKYLVGNEDIIEKMQVISALKLFDNDIKAFLYEISKIIFADTEMKNYPDLISFAFWCRKSNIIVKEKSYSNETNRLGKGIIFHIAPSNVPLSFAYSMIYGLLSGNANIIRLPSREFEQTSLLCEAISSLLCDSRFKKIQKRLCLIKYSHNKEITDALSAMCNSRIIWGGDDTINEIRKSPLNPRANEITFSNRYSICLIDSSKYLTDYDFKKVADGFYIDTFLSDQNACSSPKIIFWFGDKITRAKERFWKSIHHKLKDYDLSEVQTMNKMTTFYKYASGNECKLQKMDDYKILRIQIESINEDIFCNFGNSGYFYEYDASSLEEILPVCKLECQTISYIGFSENELQSFILENAPRGVDRVVPVGKTMDFALIWDGIDILCYLSRKVMVI